MSSRERWTVYPLLFLTLLISVKDKLTKTVTTDQIVCRSIMVTDRRVSQEPLRSIPGSIACRNLSVFNRDLQNQVMLTSGESGGYITTRGSQAPDVVLGNIPGRTGLMFVDANNRIIDVYVVPPYGLPRGRADKPAEQTLDQQVPLPDPAPAAEPVENKD